MKTLARPREFWHRLNILLERPVSEVRVRFFCQMLGFVLILKCWSSIPLANAPTVMAAATTLGLLLCALGLIVGVARLGSCILAALILSLFYFHIVVPAHNSYWHSHNVKLFILMALASGVEVLNLRHHRIIFPAFRFLQGLIFIIYLGAVLVKLNWTYLSGDLLRTHLLEQYLGSQKIESPLFSLICLLGSCFALLLEVLVPLFLCFRCSRMYGIFLGVLLHLGLMLVLPVSIFSFLMILMLLLWLPEEFELAPARVG